MPEITSVEPIGNGALKFSWKAPEQQTKNLFYAARVVPAFDKEVRDFGCEVSAVEAPTCTALDLTGNTKYSISMYAQRRPDGNDAQGIDIRTVKTRPTRKLHFDINTANPSSSESLYLSSC